MRKQGVSASDPCPLTVALLCGSLVVWLQFDIPPRFSQCRLCGSVLAWSLVSITPLFSHHGSALWVVTGTHTANCLQQLSWFPASPRFALMRVRPSSHPPHPFAALQIEEQTQIFLKEIGMFSVTRGREHKRSEEGSTDVRC